MKFAAVGAAVLVALAATLTFSPPGAGAAGRTLVVTPNKDLKNQVVQVAWTGFDPAYTVTVYQCAGTAPTSLDPCFQSLRPPTGGDPLGTGVADGQTLPNGTGNAFLEVRGALDLPQLACSTSNPCSVVAFENDGQPFPEGALPPSAVVAPLTFAPSPADCPHVQTFDVVTGGEASAAHALYTWSAAMCTGANALSVDYTESSSNAGRRNFVEGNLDLGLSSLPLDPQTEQSPRQYAYAPLDVSAVAIAFNVTDTQTHLRITDMNLTPRLVAMLIAGQQPVVGPGSHLFQDPEFLALNPGHSWPANTPPPLLRAEQNADAYLLTRWLQEDPAARTYLDGNDARPVDANWKGIAYPTDIFEARNPVNQGTYKPRSGTVQNIRRLFNFQPPGDGVLISPFFEGLTAVTDVVTAQKFGLPVAKLRAANAPAGPFVAPDTPGLAAGVAAMKPNGDQTKQADVQSAGGAYPLTKVDYAIVPQSGITEAKAGNIAAFLKFVAAKGQDAKTLPQGYSALPQDLRNQTVLVADATVKAAQPVTTPPTTVAPTNPSSGDGATPDVPDTNGDGQITTADVPSFNFNSPSFNSGSYSSSGFDDSTGGTGDEVALGDDSGSADGGGVDGGGSSGDAEAIAVHFGGGESNLVLPVLLILGVGMLVFGPVALLLARRNAGGPKPSKPPTIPQLPQPPETIALDA